MATNTAKNIHFDIKGIPFELVFVAGGTFQMGSTDFSYSQPIHAVTLPSFWIGKYPVTQAQRQAVMGTSTSFGSAQDKPLSNPSYFKGANRPVETVSWEDIKNDFLPKLQAELDEQNIPYKCALPSEAQWEYAARGGEAGAKEGLTYAGSNRLEEVAWYAENSHGQTQPVGMKGPNQLGIYDMSGNVWEWCEDDWHDSYKGNPPIDGLPWIDLSTNNKRGGYRVIRGGSWFDDERFGRLSNRYYDSPTNRIRHLGFRLVFLQSV